MPTYTTLTLNSRDLTIPKSIIQPNIGSRNVLTNEVWDYVDLYLARRKLNAAQFYWQQAREFHRIASGLPLRSAPLLLYYAYMNAAKALLTSSSTSFDPRHGVKEWHPSSPSTSSDLPYGVRIKANGVLPSLSVYYGETETSRTHTTEDLLSNLAYIHRTYCLTYGVAQEVFVPIRKPGFIVEAGTNTVQFTAELSDHHPLATLAASLPPSLQPEPSLSAQAVISKGSVTVTSVASLAAPDISHIATLAKSLREDLYYINGVETLWYIKLRPSAYTRISRQSTTITLAVMHRLSELCRYAPMDLVRYLEGPKNWLLSEFIRMSAPQFLDEIASEITGDNFLIPNVRPAN